MCARNTSQVCRQRLPDNRLFVLSKATLHHMHTVTARHSTDSRNAPSGPGCSQLDNIECDDEVVIGVVSIGYGPVAGTNAGL